MIKISKQAKAKAAFPIFKDLLGSSWIQVMIKNKLVIMTKNAISIHTIDVISLNQIINIVVIRKFGHQLLLR